MHNESATSSQEPITVGYWGIRGLAAPLRMMVMYRGVPLNNQAYDCSEKEDGSWDTSAWFSEKPPLKEKNALINLPYVACGDLLVTQSNACMQFLGRKLGMMGSSEKELVEVEQLLCEYMDVRNKVVMFAYGRADASGLDWLKGMVAHGSSIDKLHLWLQRKYPEGSKGPLVFVGGDVTAADFALWEIFDQIRLMGEYFRMDGGAFASYPLIAKFVTQFASLPGNQRYFASKLAALPANNVMAKNFGGTPSGAAVAPGMDLFWRNSSGMY